VSELRKVTRQIRVVPHRFSSRATLASIARKIRKYARGSQPHKWKLLFRLWRPPRLGRRREQSPRRWSSSHPRGPQLFHTRSIQTAQPKPWARSPPMRNDSNSADTRVLRVVRQGSSSGPWRTRTCGSAWGRVCFPRPAEAAPPRVRRHPLTVFCLSGQESVASATRLSRRSPSVLSRRRRLPRGLARFAELFLE
jgi:hypothetical protein